jgi:hypothetical protein
LPKFFSGAREKVLFSWPKKKPGGFLLTEQASFVGGCVVAQFGTPSQSASLKPEQNDPGKDDYHFLLDTRIVI